MGAHSRPPGQTQVLDNGQCLSPSLRSLHLFHIRFKEEPMCLLTRNNVLRVPQKNNFEHKRKIHCVETFYQKERLCKMSNQLTFCLHLTSLNILWDPCPSFVDITLPTWKVNGPQCEAKRGTVRASTCNLSFRKETHSF